MTVCARQGCSKPATVDPYCSRKCCEQAHGVRMAADLKGGVARTGSSVAAGRAGRLPAVTRLQQEAQARHDEAVARLEAERRTGVHAKTGGGQ